MLGNRSPFLDLAGTGIGMLRDHRLTKIVRRYFNAKKKTGSNLGSYCNEVASSLLPKHPPLEFNPHKIKVSSTKGGRHKLNVSFSYSKMSFIL
jgi:hypothetical protein